MFDNTLKTISPPYEADRYYVVTRKPKYTITYTLPNETVVIVDSEVRGANPILRVNLVSKNGQVETKEFRLNQHQMNIRPQDSLTSVGYLQYQETEVWTMSLYDGTTNRYMTIAHFQVRGRPAKTMSFANGMECHPFIVDMREGSTLYNGITLFILTDNGVGKSRTLNSYFIGDRWEKQEAFKPLTLQPNEYFRVVSTRTNPPRLQVIVNSRKVTREFDALLMSDGLPLLSSKAMPMWAVYSLTELPS